MRRIFKSLLWPVSVCVCVAAMLVTHAIKWPRAADPFALLEKETAALAGELPIDSPVVLRVVGLPEDYFNHLRYAMIPRPLETKMARARRVVLLTTDSTEFAARDRLRFERPDLIFVSMQEGHGFQLHFYQPDFHF